jgi:hypothetical protein
MRYILGFSYWLFLAITTLRRTDCFSRVLGRSNDEQNNRHCERSEAIPQCKEPTDCFVVPPRNDVRFVVSPRNDGNFCFQTPLNKYIIFKSFVIAIPSTREKQSLSYEKPTDCFVVPPRNDGNFCFQTPLNKHIMFKSFVIARASPEAIPELRRTEGLLRRSSYQ